MIQFKSGAGLGIVICLVLAGCGGSSTGHGGRDGSSPVASGGGELGTGGAIGGTVGTGGGATGGASVGGIATSQGGAGGGQSGTGGAIGGTVGTGGGATGGISLGGSTSQGGAGNGSGQGGEAETGGASAGQGGSDTGQGGTTGGTGGQTTSSSDAGTMSCGSQTCNLDKELCLKPLDQTTNGCFTGECVALNSDRTCPLGTAPGGFCFSVDKPCAVVYGGSIPCCVPIPADCDPYLLSVGRGCDCFPLEVCGLAAVGPGGTTTGEVCVYTWGGSITCQQHGQP